MFTLDQIRHIDIEITNNCNALCPQCTRTPKDGSVVQYGDFLNFNTFKDRFTPSFLNQLEVISFNGNTGDSVMHPDVIDFCQYVVEHSTGVVSLMTNGSMRDKLFWSKLGQIFNTTRTRVKFALDGLADTHELYRVNTDWDLILSHAKSFIDAGGQAVWQMIVFKHNQDQIEACRTMAKEYGFVEFDLVKSDRFPADGELKVYKRGEYSHTINKATVELTTNKVDKSQSFKKISFDNTNIQCKSQEIKWLGIYADGTVWPCCFMMGFHKMTSPWTAPIRNHINKYLELGTDLSTINLNVHSIEEILASKFYQKSLTDSFSKYPNPVCISHCSKKIVK